MNVKGFGIRELSYLPFFSFLGERGEILSILNAKDLQIFIAKEIGWFDENGRVKLKYYFDSFGQTLWKYNVRLEVLKRIELRLSCCFLM